MKDCCKPTAGSSGIKIDNDNEVPRFTSNSEWSTFSSSLCLSYFLLKSMEMLASITGDNKSYLKLFTTISQSPFLNDKKFTIFHYDISRLRIWPKQLGNNVIFLTARGLLKFNELNTLHTILCLAFESSQTKVLRGRWSRVV